LYSARSQAGQFDFAGSTARKAGGMLAGATLARGGVEAYKIISSEGK
jgi:hypothetical protein